MPIRGLPEHTDYVDEGCPGLGIARCVACPLSRCRYEMPAGQARAELDALALAVHLRAGLTMDEAAAAMGVSRRTAYRLRTQFGIAKGVDARTRAHVRRAADEERRTG